MYNIHRGDRGSVTITEVGDPEPIYSLNAETLVTYKDPDDDELYIKQVKDFTSDAELLGAIARRVYLPRP